MKHKPTLLEVKKMSLYAPAWRPSCSTCNWKSDSFEVQPMKAIATAQEHCDAKNAQLVTRPRTPLKVRLLTALGSVAVGIGALATSGAGAGVWALVGICWGICFAVIRTRSEQEVEVEA